ncbi:MAG: DNA-3-methyladenine glycosylase family protein [Candidatus Thorarchaeota archaeon]
MRTIIQVPLAYNLISSVHSWIFPDVQPTPEITTQDTFARVLLINDRDIPTKIYQEKAGTNLVVDCIDDIVSKKEIKHKVTHTFSLKLSLDNALETIYHDSILKRYSTLLSGIRPYLADTIFEGLLKTIIQQQISYRAANVITKRLVMGLSNKSKNDGFFKFPSANTIVLAGKSVLKSFGLGYKTDFVFDICRMVENGELELENLQGVSYDEATEVLLPIRGIGEWTVQALSIAALGDFSTFPYGDLAIQNVLGKLYHGGRRVSKSEVISYASALGEAGPLVLYLLMCADAMGLLP